MAHQPNVQRVPGAADPDTEPGAPRDVHLVLFGLMGSGKTTVGHLVANELGRPFVDSDSIVELRTGRRPPVVVEEGSVDELHAVELDVFRRVLAHHDPVVFAAAASIVDRVDPADLGGSWSVWLETSPGALAERVLADRHERPLIGEDPEQILAAQHERRDPLGKAIAELTVTTDGVEPNAIAARICAAWRARTA